MTLLYTYVCVCVCSYYNLFLIIEHTGSVRWFFECVELTSPTEDQWEQVMSQLKKSRIYWKIVLKSSSPESLLLVFSNIDECPVKALHIENTPLNSRCVTKLSGVLTENKKMEELRLYSSPLSPNTLHMITNALSINTKLKSLWLLNDYNITDNDLPHICYIISINRKLRRLSLDCPNITEFGVQQISKVSDKNSTLTYLYVNGNKLRGDRFYWNC